MNHLNVGVLALQGAFLKHIQKFQELGVKTLEVRKPEQLSECDALVIPGGESTTMMKHIQFIEFSDRFREFAAKKPIFGTCAGLILMSHEIMGSSMQPFNLLDVAVERNAFGSQAESFQAQVDLNLGKEPSQKFPAVFIRAPRVRNVSKNVKVLSLFEGEPILVQQGFYLGATFHPELTRNNAIHAHFLSMIKKAQAL